MNKMNNIEKPKMEISNKVKQIPEALSVYLNNIVYKMKRNGTNVTVLSLGEAFFDIPFYGFDNIDVKKGYHYSESLGIPELRKKICNYYHRQYNANVDSNKEILISAGSKPIIFMALQTILEQDDEVLIPEPAWLSYPEQIKLAGGVPRFIPYDCSVKDYNKFITDKTKAIIINNPNNPAGRIYTKEELETIYADFRSRGIYIIVDEAYSDFVTENNFYSMANIVPDKDGVIIVNSLSKNLGISGWRVGYVISTPDIIYNILKLNQHLITCGSTLLLLYLSEHFDQILDVTLPQARQVAMKKCEIENYVHSVGLETLNGTSTFYMFINIGDYKYSSLDFALYLLFKYNISVVPGLAYGQSTERFIRIGVGVESDEVLKASIDKIKEVIKNQEYDAKLVNEYMQQMDIKPFEI